MVRFSWWWRAALGVAACLVVPRGEGIAHAEDAPKAVLAISLRDAVERAEVRAPDVIMAGHAVREARARRVGAGILLPANPRLSFDLRPGVNGGTQGSFGYGTMLEFLFDVGGAPSARIREAERDADVAHGELALERVRARIAVLTAYLRARVADRRVTETNKLLEIAERILNATRQRGAAGASGDIEPSLAQTDVGELHAALQDAIHQREAQLAALRDLLDLPAEQGLELTTPLEDPSEVPRREDLIARALAARPEFELIRRRITLLDATDKRLARETFPKVGTYFGLDYAPQSPIFGQLGLSVELPFAQRNQTARAGVEAARGGEVERLELQARRVLREVDTARAAYELRRKQLKEIEEHSLPAVERTMQLVEAGWRSGRFDLFRVTSAARDVARIRGLHLDAFEAAWLERIALDRAVGGLDR